MANSAAMFVQPADYPQSLKYIHFELFFNFPSSFFLSKSPKCFSPLPDRVREIFFIMFLASPFHSSFSFVLLALEYKRRGYIIIISGIKLLAKKR